ncbi:MAG: PspA/IM30 family protein [Cyanobacteria bacterium P01_D01_bin.156]
MGLFDRVSRLIRANVNDAISKAEDPEKILEQSIEDMREDLAQMRQAVAGAIASQKKVERQYEKAQSEASHWTQRAKLALEKGEEELARQALVRKKNHAETAAALKTQLDQQSNSVDTLKRNLIGLESKISEYKTKKDMLKARASAAKANEKLQNTVGNLSTNSSVGAFERMEEKILEMEARGQAAAELAGADLESQFVSLEAGSDVESELAAMKAQLSGGSVGQEALPPADTQPVDAPVNTAVDAELEALKRELDNL